MIPAVKIELERCEGTTSEVGSHTLYGADLYARADGMLAMWARTAPASGGYNKCAFVVTFEDGETYSGRVDIKRGERPGLREHMRAYLECYSGARRPPYVAEDRWSAYMAAVPEARRAACADFLAKYEV